ncbi:apolipoprotein L3-like [Pangasianodon hypophthalmus]|uniref:apolipoprotein L3-like n=1 Tax=Pangasianodon hypophthalmus TaxID=310915 RepID=UPI002307DBB3|nr:apolipoprotein L3-like [Pangasianodon hypophthalmus]XP_053087742.1 apolipoprotein L3-like [Pangasianodon hypophthalmus]
MSKPPVPAPRAHRPMQVDIHSNDMPINQYKKPPPVPAKAYKNVRSVGQPLPGMVPPCYMPESDEQSGGEEFTVQRNNVQDSIRSLSLQSTSQTLFKSRVSSPQQTLNSQHLYQTSGSVWVQSFTWCQQDAEDNVNFMGWWHSGEPWNDYPDAKNDDAKAFTKTAKNLRKALYVYEYLLFERGENLQGHITELEDVANSIDKVHRGVKIAGITGGAAGAVGVAAAVGGVILAPLTMGASLAVAAVGVGVAAAGGVTGATAAITNKVHTNMDRKKVETILKEYSTQIEEIQKCLKFISTHIVCLKKYDLSKLRGVNQKVVKMVHKLGDNVGAVGAVSKSSGLVQGFALGLDMYFSKEDSEHLKKGSEAKFAKQIREVVKQMQASLDELMKFKTRLQKITI